MKPLQLQNTALLIPAFCEARIIQRAIWLAQALAFLLALAPSAGGDFWPRLLLISLCVHWVVLLSLLLLCQSRRYLLRFTPPWVAAFALLLMMLNALLVATVAHRLLKTWGGSHTPELLEFLLQSLLITIVVAVILMQLFWFYMEHSQQLQAQSRSELDALQARIRPHFLFNCLNTVAELTQQDAQAAERALLDLSALFRAALQAGELLPLTDELELSRQYLALEQWRLGARLQVRWHLPAQVPKLQLPCLTLQPLLENAVRYGVERRTQPSVIEISMHVSKHNISLIITNPLPTAAEPVRSSHSGNGMALDNIKRRLHLLYGDQASLGHSVLGHEYRVKLVLPLTN